MKILKTITIIATVMIASASSVQAEDYNTIGISYVNTTLTPKHGDNMSLNGFGVNYTHGFSLSQAHPMYLEAGLKFSMGFDSESEEYEGASYSQHNTLGSFTVPVSFAWKFQLNNKFSIKPYAGINLKLHVLGQTKYSYEDYEYEDEDETVRVNWFDKKEMGAKFNRAQVGWHIGAAFQYTALSLSLSYGTDFNQITKNVNSGTFDLTLGYNF